MSDRDKFYLDLKEWNNIDKEVQNLQENINKLKNKKNNLKNNIITFVENNNLNNAIIKINNDQLRFINYKSFQPLTYKFLKECLIECIKDKEQVELLFNYIKEQRLINNYLDIKVYK